MNSLFYLHKRILINGFKRSMRKPAFVLMLIATIAYFALILSGYKGLFQKIGITDASEYIVLFMLLQLYLGVPGLIQYFKRKGLIFRKADVQFVFQSPIHPKLILLFSGLRSVVISSIFFIVLCVFGCILYPSYTLQFVMYASIYLTFDFFIEMSLVILCYGNETIPNHLIRFVSYILYVLLGALAIGFLLVVLDQGFHISILVKYLQSPLIKLFPLFGWSIGLLQWIFYGYHWSNVVGYYAKAIFYRQLLEYKKNRFFIFSVRSFLFLLGGIILYFLSHDIRFMRDIMHVRLFVIPIIVTYFITFFGIVRSKWMKELQNYYTFLLPDSKIHKTWNATKIEHIRAFVDTMLIAIVGGAALDLSPLQILLTGLVGVSVNASRIYINMMVQTIISPTIGDFKVFVQFIDMFLMLISTAASVFVAVVSMIFFNNPEAAFLGLIITSCIMAIIAFFLSSLAFEKMEVVE